MHKDQPTKKYNKIILHESQYTSLLFPLFISKRKISMKITKCLLERENIYVKLPMHIIIIPFKCLLLFWGRSFSNFLVYIKNIFIKLCNSSEMFLENIYDMINDISQLTNINK